MSDLDGKAPFGWTGEQLYLVGQGTWKMDEGDRDQAISALRVGLDLGLTLIDTAEMYGGGQVETMVGEAIAGRRDEVFLVSKVLPSNATYEGTKRACERSLQRLKVDRLDLYLLHWRSQHPLKETMRAFEELGAVGLTRYIGVSNVDLDDLKQAQSYLRNERLACNQVLYHLEDRGIERNLVPFCKQQEIAVMGYSPFGSGAFPPPGPGADALAAVAAELDRTVRQVTLNFLTRDGVFTIPKSGRREHVRENAGGQGWRLSDEHTALIDHAWPAPGHDTPLGMI